MTSSLLRWAFKGSVLLCALSTASAARADLPPPAGFVETCTVEHETTADKTCVLCGDAYYAHPDACSVKFAPTGYTQSCRSHGASTWKEVWCKKSGVAAVATTTPSAVASAPEAAPAASAAEPAKPNSADETTKQPPDTAPKHGCGACQVGAPQGVSDFANLAVALGLLGTALARRQRRI